MPDESDEATLELANDLVSQRLETQKSGIERTETKTTLLLGFGLVGLQFVLTRSRHTGWMLVAVLFYGASFISGLAGIFLYEHDFPPDPERLVAAYLELPRWHVLDVVVRTRADAFYRNTRHARFKRRAWFATLIALAVAVGLSVLALWKG